MAMLAATIASIIESVGDYYACARISCVPPPPTHAVNRGIAIEGFGSIISGIVGSGGATTSYSQNVGAIGFTKVNYSMEKPKKSHDHKWCKPLKKCEKKRNWGCHNFWMDEPISKPKYAKKNNNLGLSKSIHCNYEHALLLYITLKKFPKHLSFPEHYDLN